MSSTQTTLPLSGLRLDPANVRKIGRGVSPAFLANIKAMGVKQPLLVRPNGNGHLVTDGGKRLEALQAMAKAGDIPADHPVPVIIEDVNDATARETSLALNVIREAMHPVDKFRAFANVHHDKTQPMDVAAIASHFGVTQREVEQSLALGSLADRILDAWRDGQIDEDAAQAFTLCASKKAQAAIFDQLAKRGRVDRWSVKAALKIGEENAGRLLNIVGQAAYEKAGGKVTVDLFGTDHVVSDVGLLKTLVDEKIKAKCDALIADGWSWATAEQPANAWNYGRLEAKGPTKAQREQLDELRRKYDALDEQGCDEDSPEAIDLERQIDAIEAVIAAHAYSPAQKAKAGCFVGINHRGDAIEVSYGRVKPVEQRKSAADKGKPEKKAKSQSVLSQALKQRLRLQMLKATKAALVADLGQPGRSLAGLLAGIVAEQIDVNRPYGMPSAVERNLTAIRNAITPKVMNEHQRKAFDASDYFSSAPKAFNLRAIAEAINADESRKIAGKKKAEIARFALQNVGKSGWLPQELRTSHYDGPSKKTKRK